MAGTDAVESYTIAPAVFGSEGEATRVAFAAANRLDADGPYYRGAGSLRGWAKAWGPGPADGLFPKDDGPVGEGALSPVPPRVMWGWGPGMVGFCGECSVQTALLRHGAYVSQERVRYAARNEELLLGSGNDTAAMRRLCLAHDVFNAEDALGPGAADEASAFTSWCTGHLGKGRAVLVGVFMRCPAGDEDYDHIVVLRGLAQVPRPLLTNRATVAPSAWASSSGTAVVPVINDLYHPQPRAVAAGFWDRAQFKGARPDAAARYEYALPTTCYGVAATGATDPLAALARRRTGALPPPAVFVNGGCEPDWGAEDKVRAAPSALSVTLVVDLRQAAVGIPSGACVWSEYAVLRFDGVAALTAAVRPSSGGETPPMVAGWSRRVDLAPSTTDHDPRRQWAVLPHVDTVRSDAEVFYRVVAKALIADG